jgi:hypothetical protein
MTHATRWFGLTLAAIGIMTGSAEAGLFMVSGQLGTDTGAVTGLAGGSFDGTYSVTGLPAPSGGFTYFDSFDLDIRNSSGQIVYALTSAGSDIGGIYGDHAGSGRDLMDFFVAGGNLPNLQLAFTRPFDGIGQAIPTDPSTSGSMSLLLTPAGNVNVISGASSLFTSAVPEPSSFVLSGAAVLAALLVECLRRLGSTIP